MKQGLIHIYTGDGKGKTTAAMGLALRALGHQKKVFILQFLKGRQTGEKVMLEQLNNVKFQRTNTSSKFYFEMNEIEKKKLQEETINKFNLVKQISKGNEYEIIILDEIMGAIKNKLIRESDVITLFQEKGGDKEIILTGRDAPVGLIDMADYVTEMKMIKHPYQQDISARSGIEF